MISKTNMKREYVFYVQILTVSFIIFASQNFELENPLNNGSVILIARYVIYLLTITGSEGLIILFHNVFKSHSLSKVKNKLALHVKSWYLYLGAIGLLLYYGEGMFRWDFVLLAIANLLIKYPQLVSQTAHISYGTGMACSFFEGYLVNVIPPDGSNFEGVQGAIRKYEAQQKVIFPVRKLFLIITKSLHCPPDLTMLNKQHRPDLPYLDKSASLEDVQKDVAGVRARIYRNSTYKIVRRAPLPPVYLAAECATPLHTLHKVKNRTHLYRELMQADFSEIQEDFCSMLGGILGGCPECRGKVEIVHYDDTDASQNLADVLLQRIEQLVPHYEELIATGSSQ